MPSLTQLMQGGIRSLLPAIAIGLTSSPAMGNKTMLDAERFVPLPNHRTLVQTSKFLEIRRDDGSIASRLNIRSEHLDVRTQSETGLALVVDRDTRQAIPIHLDLKKELLTSLPPLPVQGLAIESVCMHRDHQGLLHAFVVGQDGIAQQWLLNGLNPIQLRQLALSPNSEACKVDDVSASLFALEPGIGLWAYGITQDAPIQRQLIGRTAHQGPLPAETEHVETWRNGVAILSDSGQQLLQWAHIGQQWLPLPNLTLRAKADAISASSLQGQSVMHWRDAVSKTWHSVNLRTGTPNHVKPPIPTIAPTAQTEPVQTSGDAADDPAIWVHPTQATASRILGTNKKRGLDVYALDGKRLQTLPVGRINNVDLRQDIDLGGARLDLAVASNRSDNSMTVFSIDPNGHVNETARLPSGLNEVYGICLHKPKTGGLHIIINDKDGRFRQFAISVTEGQFKAQLLREFSLKSQPEGCVVDDQSGNMFFGEEDKGVWLMSADSRQAVKPRLIAKVGAQLVADVEGLGIFKGKNQDYLIVSSQGDHSYVVLNAHPPFRFVGKFRIGINLEKGIDATSETDGLEVTSASLGGMYGKGALVVQDGYKRLPDGAQNFKLVPWSDIAQALRLND